MGDHAGCVSTINVLNASCTQEQIDWILFVDVALLVHKIEDSHCQVVCLCLWLCCMHRAAGLIYYKSRILEQLLHRQ